MSDGSVLFRDVRVFDGLADTLTPPVSVLVSGSTIERISEAPVEPGEGTRAIDGAGRVLMPGLIDAHWHTFMAAMPMAAAMTADMGYLTAHAIVEAERTLLRGFTSVRDAGGPVFGIKRAIDDGTIAGPRIWPSGAMISQTSGHGDFRLPFEVPRADGDLSYAERIGLAVIADGADEVLRRSREQLRQGASQLKLMAGGGVSSHYDPLDATQYTERELRAAVEAATDWGTYVMVHAYTPRAIRNAVAAGVRCIEHGQLMDEDTARLLADEGVWLCLQPFLGDADANPKSDPVGRAKQEMVATGTVRAFELAKRFGIRTAFGTDTLGSAALATRQGAQLTKLARWHTPAGVLRMATSEAAELLALSGLRSPYPGRLGVVAEGAVADLLLVDGDPLADLELIAQPATSFVVILKGGRIVRDLLA
ncbi:MAG: amidohydrolase family protein [Chloroflexi bacterium]|nr:amidohydrolase family protein [Chloroflexota bacterium]